MKQFLCLSNRINDLFSRRYWKKLTIKLFISLMLMLSTSAFAMSTFPQHKDICEVEGCAIYFTVTPIVEESGILKIVDNANKLFETEGQNNSPVTLQGAEQNFLHFYISIGSKYSTSTLTLLANAIKNTSGALSYKIVPFSTIDYSKLKTYDSCSEDRTSIECLAD